MTVDFKWLLYGDDDTLFFMDAVANVVKNLDHNVPYFLTGKGGPKPSLTPNLPAKGSRWLLIL